MNEERWTNVPTPILLDDHSARHENGGADEISVTGLSGLLADDQHVLDAEVLAVAEASGAVATHSALTTGIHGVGASVVCSESTADSKITTHASNASAHALPQFAKAYAKIDLSGAAVSDIPILHTSRACTLLKAIILYTEASSADAGVLLEIGKETDANYYYTGDSETGQALWYEKDTTLLQTDIAAGDTVICGCAGGKTGTGEVLICIEFKVN